MRHTIVGVIVVLVVAGLGVAICPRTPQQRGVDSDAILEGVISSGNRTNYSSVQRHTWTLLGKTCEREIKFDSNQWTNHTDDTLKDLLKTNYEPLVEGEEKIASRPAWVLRLKPVGENRKRHPWKQLWIDKKTGVVLASRDWTARNVAKRSMKTVRIAYNKPSENAVFAATNQPLRIAHKYISPKYTPSGYELIESQYSDSVMRHTYSDGLYAITIKLTPRLDKLEGCNSLRPGVVYDSGQGFMLLERRKGKYILIIADLPAEELQKISNSIL